MTSMRVSFVLGVCCIAEQRWTQNDTLVGVFSCSACIVLRRNNAEHQKTPMRVSFRPGRYCRGDGMTLNTKIHPHWSLFVFGILWVCSRCVEDLWTRDEGGPSSSVN